MTPTGIAEAVRRWLLSRSGLWAAALWGFAEGTVFFLVPDIFLTATALFSVRRSLNQMAAALAGSLAAGALLYGFAVYGPAPAGSLVRSVPFVRETMFDKVDQDFRTSGVWALCKGPMSGVPYKVYAVKAPPYASWWPFLLVSIPARLERFVITWALFSLIGVFLRNRVAAALGFHILYWIGIYAYYWSVV